MQQECIHSGKEGFIEYLFKNERTRINFFESLKSKAFCFRIMFEKVRLVSVRLFVGYPSTHTACPVLGILNS